MHALPDLVLKKKKAQSAQLRYRGIFKATGILFKGISRLFFISRYLNAYQEVKVWSSEITVAMLQQCTKLWISNASLHRHTGKSECHN